MKANVVIDIEMCIVQKEYQWKDYPYEHEIIQIGAVMMDEAYEITGEFSSYVRPKHGRIDHFIQELTGISDRNILEAPNLEGALDNMLSWLSGHEVIFYSWSKTDYVQIAREIQAKGIDEEKMAVFLDKEHWVDYQPIAGKRFGKPWNTARLIAKMEKNPESRFLQDRLEKEKDEEPLGTSLGSLLGNIRI